MARSLVPAAHWRRGLIASERIGHWLETWEERARRIRAGEDPPPPPKPRRRKKTAAKTAD
jgi:hypothetical protein